jgi:hypothetical protein
MRQAALLILLTLLLGACGMFHTTPDVVGPKVAGSNSSYDILIEFLRIIPMSIDALSGMIGAVVIGMVILSFVFRTTRRAMALFITAIFGALTQRVREWRDRERPKDLLPPPEPEVDSDLNRVEKESVNG